MFTGIALRPLTPNRARSAAVFQVTRLRLTIEYELVRYALHVKRSTNGCISRDGEHYEGRGHVELGLLLNSPTR